MATYAPTEWLRSTRISTLVVRAGMAMLLASSAGVAAADTILASLFSPLAPVGGAPLDLSLVGITPPFNSPFSGNGFNVVFSPGFDPIQGVVQGTLPAIHDVPVAGVSGGLPEYLTADFGSPLTTDISQSGNYFSTGTGTITITFSTPQTSFALLWGSIDAGNQLSFNDAAGDIVTGAEVQAAASGFVSNGFQGPGGSAYVVIDTDTPFTTITATSNVVSFEFAGLGVANQDFTLATVPEPDCGALAGIGMAFLIGRRRMNRQSA